MIADPTKHMLAMLTAVSLGMVVVGANQAGTDSGKHGEQMLCLVGNHLPDFTVEGQSQGQSLAQRRESAAKGIHNDLQPEIGALCQVQAGGGASNVLGPATTDLHFNEDTSHAC